MLIAAALMTAAAALHAVDSVIVRHLTADMHPFVIVFFRGLFGLLAVSPWILRCPARLKSNYRILHLLRAALKIFSLVALTVAIGRAPLADVTAIAFATPIYVTVGAWILLGERLLLQRVLAVMLGFSGVVLILSPAFQSVSPALWWAVLGAALAAVIQLMLKAMSRRDSVDTLVSWNLILTAPLALGPAIWFWTTPSMEQMILLTFQGAAGALNMSMVTRSMSLAPATYVAPFDFLRLPFVSILAFAFFGEVVGLNTWIGAAIVFVATLLLISPPTFWKTCGSGK